MNAAGLDALIAAEHALIAALDADDLAAIERATTDYANALRPIKTIDKTEVSDLGERATEALRLADAARAKVNLLVDRTRQRLALLSRATGREPRIGYHRDGRMRR